MRSAFVLTALAFVLSGCEGYYLSNAESQTHTAYRFGCEFSTLTYNTTRVGDVITFTSTCKPEGRK